MITLATIETAKKNILSLFPNLAMEALSVEEMIALAETCNPELKAARQVKEAKERRESELAAYRASEIQKCETALSDIKSKIFSELESNNFWHLHQRKDDALPLVLRISELQRGAYPHHVEMITNAMGFSEEVEIDSEEAEKIYRVFVQLRKMNVSRRAICSYLMEVQYPHIVTYNELTQEMAKNISRFRSKMLKWNDTHFNHCCELAELLK
jgi:hypothetical protein